MSLYWNPLSAFLPRKIFCLLSGLLILNAGAVSAVDLPGPSLSAGISTNGQKLIQFTPYPAADQYNLLLTPAIGQTFARDTNGSLSGFQWRGTNSSLSGFYQLEVVPMSSNALLTATLLNRLAYGATPDELERVSAIGPQAFIDEQLAPELIQENLSFETITTNFGSGWQYFTATGTPSSTNLYVYLTVPGDCYIDDLMLVAGTVPGSGPNLIRNGDFEVPLTTNDWNISANHAGSRIVSDVTHGGAGSLHVVATSGGTSQGSAIWQAIQGPLTNSRYALSYWFLPSTNNALSSLTVRLSGSGIASSPYPVSLLTRLNGGAASLDELRAWHLMRAVGSQRQLLEILDQFLENHFVTEHSKSRDYLDIYYDDGSVIDQNATQFEFKENQRWRQALMNPQCSFYDLLRISAESPAMIIYLDSVNSKGNGSNIANENYARELLELFTFGVDNGYDQNDITMMSRAWTGWSVNIMAKTNEFNPLATDLRVLNPGVAVSNLVGVWSFQYKQANHNTAVKTNFPGKTVPARFGAPYAGRSYQLVLPARSGTNGLADGYDVLAHLANQPFTQEYICIKLCRLFVHDEFPNPSNDPSNQAYAFYNYAAGNLSPEADLVRQCMIAWENGSPKGQIRDVLRVIFNSDLFRGHGGSLQKVKTPLEYTVSAVRALRSPGTNGTFTSSTDGSSLISPLNRMGSMFLFDRAEPNGYPEVGTPWISAGTLAERLRFVQSYLTAVGAAVARPTDAGNTVSDPVTLLRNKLPANSWRNAGEVADFFLGILFPGEGKANLGLYRDAAIKFLDTADNGALSPFNLLAVSNAATSPYDVRVRGMVSMLMTSQRFQEQ